MQVDQGLNDLNSNLNLYSDFYSLFPENDVNNDYKTDIRCKFYDTNTFKSKLNGDGFPALISLNVQSLLSKHQKLAEFIADLQDNDKQLCYVIALQEVWALKYPELVQISGYNLVTKLRGRGNGGGVGFYVKKGLNFKVLQNLSTCIDKTFEALTIECTISGKKHVFTSIYRSPTVPAGVTPSQHLDEFNDRFNTLLQNLSDLPHPAYVCLDANINQLVTHSNHLSFEYFTTIFTNGFVQCISKATRVQGNSKSLIDHILTNKSTESITSGTIICDISDHFATFVALDIAPPTSKEMCPPKKS